MAADNKYKRSSDDQVFRIRKIANNVIFVIWVAGILGILTLAGYFLFYSENAWINEKNYNDKTMTSARQKDEFVFTDKTTLVNIGLRVQVIPEETEPEPGGTIGINKIIHDQKLKKINKPVKTDFSIKPVPK